MPLKPVPAKTLIRRLLDDGKFVSPSERSHARKEMNKDGLTDVDLVNVLRGGTVEPSEVGKRRMALSRENAAHDGRRGV